MKHTKAPHQHERGEIRDNALQALVTSPLFRPRIENNKKGKGSYRRVKNRRDWESSIKSSICGSFNTALLPYSYRLYHFWITRSESRRREMSMMT